MNSDRIRDNTAALAAMEFMLNPECECPMEFLRCWNEGNFDAIRDEWPEAPEAVFVGAEVTSPGQAEQK